LLSNRAEAENKMTAPHPPLWHRIVLLLLITAGAALAFELYVKLSAT
jgi:hypothetical protein